MNARQAWEGYKTEMRVRRAAPADRAILAEFLGRMDRDGLYERHFAHGEAPNLALLGRLEKTGSSNRAVILAVGADGSVVGHAEYVAEAAAAEFALMVLPSWRDCGVGGALLDFLMEAAVKEGQLEMHGLIQATNTRAIRLARKRGFRIRAGDDRTTVIVSRPLVQQPAENLSAPWPGATIVLPEGIEHDPDRTSLHCCPVP